jgi:hypothetical protein
MNVDRTGDPLVSGILAAGDAFCHTDPAFAYGLSFALAHARALADAIAEAPDVDAIVERYRADAGPEARERHALACATDAARSLRWSGEPLEIGRRDGCYPLFSFVGALAAAPHDDEVLRRTIRRIGLLDRTAVFDEDDGLHDRIETILAQISARRPSPPGPPRKGVAGPRCSAHAGRRSLRLALATLGGETSAAPFRAKRHSGDCVVKWRMPAKGEAAGARRSAPGLQARNTGLIVTYRGINVVRRGSDGAWRYAIALLSRDDTTTEEKR